MENKQEEMKKKKQKWSKTFIPENEKVLRHKLQD